MLLNFTELVFFSYPVGMNYMHTFNSTKGSHSFSLSLSVYTYASAICIYNSVLVYKVCFAINEFSRLASPATTFMSKNMSYTFVDCILASSSEALAYDITTWNCIFFLTLSV